MRSRAQGGHGQGTLGWFATAAHANGALVFPAGQACNFQLSITSDGGGRRVERTF